MGVSLTKHFDIEYSLHSDRLPVLESYGVIDDADMFSLKIRDILMKKIKDGGLFGEITIESEIDCFDDVTIDANITMNSREQCYRYGEYKYSSSSRHPKIRVDLRGSFLYVRNSIAPLVCHELLHAYENDKRREHGVKDISFDDDGTYRLSTDILGNSKAFSKNAVMLAKCMYWLSGKEQRANLGTLELELKQYADELWNPVVARNTIKLTSIYSKYLEIKKCVEEINKWDDDVISDVCEEIKLKLMKDSISVSSVKKYIIGVNTMLARFEDKLETNSTKLAYEIGRENSNTIE